MNTILQTISQENTGQLWEVMIDLGYDTKENSVSVTDLRSSTTLNGNPKTLASSISYLPYGGVTGLTYGNNLSLSQGYDNQYRTSSIVVDPVLDRTYEYDANGNVTSFDDGEAAGNEALETAGIYTYDQDANLLADILGEVQFVYDYDYNANTVSANNRTYVYDSSNQLIQVLDNSNLIAEYTYNGAGQRIKKWTSSETRIFHYDLKGHLIAETNQSGTMLAEYVYLGDQLLAMIKPGENVYYFHNDHLGTPQVLTDGNGSIVWKAAYTPFGQANITVGTVENNFRFPGQYYDQETELHYNYFRYYDPTTGRYITPDPIGLEGGINLWPYAANNPLILLDILGLLYDLLPYEVPGLLSIFDPNFGTLTVYDPNYRNILATYEASNVTVNPCGDPCKVDSHGPAPEGVFPVQGPFKSTDPTKKMMYGPYFWQIGAVGPGGARLDIARQRGLGIHGGRQPRSPTEGCIRLSNRDIIRLNELTLKRPLVQIMILGRTRSYP